jgi:hypothetical protein
MYCLVNEGQTSVKSNNVKKTAQSMQPTIVKVDLSSEIPTQKLCYLSLFWHFYIKISGRRKNCDSRAW